MPEGSADFACRQERPARYATQGLDCSVLIPGFHGFERGAKERGPRGSNEASRRIDATISACGSVYLSSPWRNSSRQIVGMQRRVPARAIANSSAVRTSPACEFGLLRSPMWSSIHVQAACIGTRAKADYRRPLAAWPLLSGSDSALIARLPQHSPCLTIGISAADSEAFQAAHSR